MVVLVTFPFSDLSMTKLRPAVVLADSGKDDWVLCQITSKSYGDAKAIILTNENFENGSLKIISYVRPGKLFTANNTIMVTEVGKLKNDITRNIVVSVVNIIKSGIKN
ncbi:MAG: type II toxin-antitoxin system PemK/MazF family toxin [Desulfamplus sp.]|nr:type II toxin-antitoxin system PemK/MazF family toxin [Desulfamplus sp.]